MKLELAELKKRLQVRSVLAITLESGRVAVDLVRRDNGSCHVEQSLTLSLGSESVATDPEKAGRELAALLVENGIRERRCVVCVPAGWSLTTSAVQSTDFGPKWTRTGIWRPTVSGPGQSSEHPWSAMSAVTPN